MIAMSASGMVIVVVEICHLDVADGGEVLVEPGAVALC